MTENQAAGSPLIAPGTVPVTPVTPSVPEADATTQIPRRLRQPTADQLKPGQYCWGTGRRKSSVARVRVRPGDGKFIVNKKDLKEYFAHGYDQTTATNVLELLSSKGRYDVYVNVKGGGTTGQAGAILMGLARAMISADPETFEAIRDAGYLTRDSRMSERKKYGRKKARKSFQFSKR